MWPNESGKLWVAHSSRVPATVSRRRELSLVRRKSAVSAGLTIRKEEFIAVGQLDPHAEGVRYPTKSQLTNI